MTEEQKSAPHAVERMRQVVDQPPRFEIKEARPLKNKLEISWSFLSNPLDVPAARNDSLPFFPTKMLMLPSS